MRTDQYSTLNQRNGALLPNRDLIEGRSERDLLAFMVEFARLINFYDRNNQLHGHWAPVLLKDPVILLASISHAEYLQKRSIFRTTIREIEGAPGINSAFHDMTRQIAGRLIFTVDLVLKVACEIGEWGTHMQNSSYQYPLRTQFFHEITQAQGPTLWSIIALRNQILGLDKIAQRDQPHSSFLGVFENSIWDSAKGMQPFWKTLGLGKPASKCTCKEILGGIDRGGEQLLQFYTRTIQKAERGYEALKDQNQGYPDTVLVRTFVRLVGIYKKQLNGIANKHLQFYYRKILQQFPKDATPDRAFLFVDLAETGKLVSLPAGSTFLAGLDSDEQPILFKSLKSKSLNPGVVVKASTLTQLGEMDHQKTWVKHDIPSPGTIRKSEDGRIQSWPTFGPGNTAAQDLPMGIAFASPILLLKEGHRNLSIEIDFVEPFNPATFTDVTFALSTGRGWHPIKPIPTDHSHGTPGAPVSSHTLKFKLAPKEPAIVAFEEPVEEIGSIWPIFKMSFEKVSDPGHPPRIASMTISVSVSEMTGFSLFNDFGRLDPQNPFEPFGPIAANNSNFYIGIVEVFSKPIESLDVKVVWDLLPDDFVQYYQTYNKFFANAILPSGSSSSETYDNPFNNGSFRGRFSLLEYGNWKPLHKARRIKCSDDQPVSGASTSKSLPLFCDTTDSDCVITRESCFSILSKQDEIEFAPHPELQHEPLTWSEDTKDGFVRLQLTHPKHGFGNDVYPQVVSEVALANAKVMLKEVVRRRRCRRPSPSQYLTVNPPYFPTVSHFEGNYSAKKEFKFEPGPDTYPLECFLYTPFQNYKVYDNRSGMTVPDTSLAGKKLAGKVQPENTVPLFAAHPFKGSLFLEFQELIAPGELNLLYEMAPAPYKQMTISPGDLIYRYLGTNGWQKLRLLSDGTGRFRQSGILRLEIPEDITSDYPSMPEGNFVIAISASRPRAHHQTVYVQCNGLEVERESAHLANPKDLPELPALSIEASYPSLPEISNVTQAFPSFGGRAAEGEQDNHQRISVRLKTKDRVSFATDFSQLIPQTYPGIFHALPVYDRQSNSTYVYLVRKIRRQTSPDAFNPQVNTIDLNQVEDFLSLRVSSFARIRTVNFNFQYVQVEVKLTVLPKFECQEVKASVAKTIDLFFSPWIEGEFPKRRIGEGVTADQVANLIRKVPGVYDVTDLFFTSPILSASEIEPETYIAPLRPGNLLVTSRTHTLNCKVL